MYSRLVSWEVYNFMVYSYAKCEFDERGIITIKGYNDSGKSTMLQALNVLFFNSHPSMHINYIKDDCDYFRIMAHFDDGVSILRDKYINGQSLYEMYKDGEVIYSTRNGNTLTRVSKVPDPIEQYLGLISHDGTCLNSRSCIEKQLLVQTTGSENYKFFNVVLKSEEIAVASQMLNTDKNKLLQDINSTTYQLQTTKTMLGNGNLLTDELISELERSDKLIDEYDVKLDCISSALGIADEVGAIQIPPDISQIDNERVSILSSINGIVNEIASIPTLPEVNQLDSSRLELLTRIMGVSNELSSIPVIPNIQGVSTDRFSSILDLSLMLDSIETLDENTEDIDNKLVALDQEMKEYADQLRELGRTVIRCPNCGTVYDSDMEHDHEVFA